MSESPEERMANNKVYSVDAFAAGIKSNHPEYQEVDNQELVAKMLEKYPQYRSQVDYSPVGGWAEEPVQTSKKKDSTELESTGRTNPTELVSQPQNEIQESLGRNLVDSDEPVGFFESVSNSATNIGKSLSLLDDKFNIITDAVFTSILGKETADSFYEWSSENLWGENFNETTRKAFEEIESVQGSMGETRGIIESVKKGDVVGVAAGTVNAISSLATSIIEGSVLYGIPLAVDVVGGSIANYNIEKAKTLGVEPTDLWESEEAEILMPAITGALSYGLEKFGQGKLAKQLKGSFLNTEIGAEAVGKFGATRLGKAFMSNPNREGMTELTQGLIEEFSLSDARGESFDAIGYLSSEEAWEQYVMGAVGAKALDLGGKGANRFIYGTNSRTQEKQEYKKTILTAEEAIQDPETPVDEKRDLRKTQNEAASKIQEIQEEEAVIISKYSDEDKTKIAEIDREIKRKSGILKRSKKEETKNIHVKEIEKLISSKKAIESKYENQDKEPITDEPAQYVQDVVEKPVKTEKKTTTEKEKAPKAEEVKVEQTPEVKIKTPKAEVPETSEEAKKKLEAVAKVRAAAPKSRYSGVKSRIKSTERGYKTVIEKTDKRTGKVTSYEGDVFVNPKTGKVTHTVTEFVDGKKKGEAKSYKDVKSFRDAINKKIKAGAKESEAFAREYDASPEGKSAAESARVVEFAEEKTKAPVKSKRVVEKVTYKRDGKIVELKIQVNGSNRQRQLPYATVTNVTEGGKARRFETKQQYDKFRNEQLARRNDVKVETISETVMEKDAEGVFVKQEAPTEVKGVFKRPVPVTKGTTKTQRKRTTRKPFQPVVHAQVPQESRVYIVRDGKGNDRLFQKTIGKDGEFATYEVEEKTFAGGVKRYEIKEGAKKYEGQREFIKALREETTPKKETKVTEETTPKKEAKKEAPKKAVKPPMNAKSKAQMEAAQKRAEELRAMDKEVVTLENGKEYSIYEDGTILNKDTGVEVNPKGVTGKKVLKEQKQNLTEGKKSKGKLYSHKDRDINFKNGDSVFIKDVFNPVSEEEVNSMTFEQLNDSVSGYVTPHSEESLISKIISNHLLDSKIKNTPNKKLTWYRTYIDKYFNTKSYYGNKPKDLRLSELLYYVIGDGNVRLSSSLASKSEMDFVREGFKKLGVDLDVAAREAYIELGFLEANKERSSLAVRTKDRQEVSNKRGVKPFVIREAIAKAKSILRTLSPDVVFITHENTKAFNEAMTAYSQNGVNERSAEGGRYIYNTATGAREIHINLEFATASTPIHEAFHAFFDKAYNQDPMVAKDLAKVLYVALRRGSKADKAIAKKLEGFIKRYDESVQSEEFLAELAGIMSEAEQTLSKPMIQKLSDAIKKFLLKLANKAGIDNRLVDYLRYDVLSNEAQQEAVQFMRSFINANSDSFLDPMNQPIPLAKNQDVKLEGVVKEMSELTDDYKKESKGFLLDYFQSGKEIKKGIAAGRIKFKAKMSELDGKAYLLHQPDNASVGIIKDENGNVIGENFGGMLFPERFKGAFWASTRSAAVKMASDLNAMRTLGDGKIRMVLTAGTQEKLFSSTAASRNVGSMIENYVSIVKMSKKQELSMYQSVYDKIFRKAGELNKMIDKQAELTDLKANGKISNSDLAKLNEINEKVERLSEAGLITVKTDKKGHVSVSQRKFKNSDDIKSVLYNVKDADVSIFPLRKDITSLTISSFVASLDKKQKSILIDKFGYEKVSGLEIRDSFSEILSEPAINGVQTGMAYAVLETSSEVEAVEVTGENAHPSYPYQIRLKDPKAEVTIKILEKPENPHDADHYDFSKDFTFTNQLKAVERMTEVQLSKHSKLLDNQMKTMFPPTSGMSQILFRNINKNTIEDINNNVDKIEPYKNLTALQKFRAKNKKKYSDFYTRERSQLSPEEQQLFDAQESVDENPNLFARLRSRRGLRDMFEGLGQFAEEKGLVFTETQKKVRTFLESMNSQLSFSALAVRKHASRLRKLTKTPEALAEVRAYITESNPEAKQAIADRIEKMPKGDAIIATADSMRAMIDNLSQVFLDNPLFDSLPERAFKEVQSYKTKDGKTMYRVVNTKTGGIIDADLTKAAAEKVADAPSIKDSIRANLGSYLHTSYRFFSSKDYKITDKAKRKAYEAEYEVAKMNEFKSLIKDGKTQEEALEILKQPETINRLIDEATESINKYVSEIEAMREDPDFVFTGLSANSIKIPKTALQQKKGIPEHIAELLGKEKDPVNSFIDTAMVMHKTIFKTQMVKKISDAFGGDFVKDEVTDAELNSGNWKKVKDQYSPINGKYVKTEIFEMLQSKPLLQAENAVLNAYFKGLKVMRKSKVVWNLPTWRKNLTGGMFFIAANGVLNPAFLKDFKNRIDRTRKGEANPEIESLLKEMSELGLIGADVNAGLIDVNDAAMNVLFDEDFNGAEAHLNKIWTKVKNTDAKLAEKYAAIDDYTKLIIYRVERESFAKKLYGKDYASLTEAQQTKVRDEAGEFVKQNTPTFSRLPKWYINSFSKVPLGDFLGFKLESWRSITANLRNATADIKKSSDTSLSDVQRKEYLAAGRRRMMGSIATLGARAVVPAILTSMFLGDDDEEIADDALAIRPEWMEGHSLIVKNISDDGVVSVYNYSMEDPYGEISDALMGDLTGFADFMSPNMFVKLAVHLTEGRDAYGRDLYDKSDPAVSKFAKIMGYTTKSMILPPSLVSTAKYQENQMLIRDYKYNLGQQFYFTAREYTKGKPYNELTGRARKNRLEALDDVKMMYDSVMRVAQHKGNASMMVNASKVLNRFSKVERAYIRGGFEIEE